MDFNYTRHANMLHTVMRLVCDSLTTTEGLLLAEGQMDGQQYNELAAGALGLMTTALERAWLLLSEHEHSFSQAHDIVYEKGGIAVLRKNTDDETEV